MIHYDHLKITMKKHHIIKNSLNVLSALGWILFAVALLLAGLLWLGVVRI